MNKDEEPKVRDKDLAPTVYERLSENYFEQRRLQYRLLVGYFVGIASVAWFVSNFSTVFGDSYLKCLMAVGSLLFTVAVIFWLRLLDRSQSISKNKLIALTRILLGPDADNKLKEHDRNGFSRFYIWVLGIAAAIIWLVFVLILWALPYQGSAPTAETLSQPAAEASISSSSNDEGSASETSAEPPVKP